MKLYVKTRCRFLGLEVCGEKMRQKTRFSCTRTERRTEPFAARELAGSTSQHD